MIAGRVKTRAEVEAELRARGCQPTNSTTGTGRFWRTPSGGHIEVPDPIDDMYPDFILRDLLDRLKQMGVNHLH